MWDCYEDRFKLQEVGDNFQMLQGGSVTSVNGKVGAVVLTAEDVGALPDTYEAPVTSVNTKTGAVVLDSGDIAYESTTVEEELGTINSALSSLSSVTEIIDTASGAIASFPDGSGLPMRSLVAQINPVQDLHGQSSPYPAGGGENVLEPNVKYSAGNYNGIVVTTTNGYEYVFNGTSTAAGIVSTPSIAKEDAVMLPAGTYSLAGGRFLFYRADDTEISRAYAPGPVTINEPFFVKRVYWEFGSGTTYTNRQIFLAMVKGSTAPTAWSPYENLCPITGHTGLSVEVRGGNLLDKTGAVRGGFDASGNVLVNSGDSRCVTVFLEIKPNVTYYIDQTIPLTQGRSGFWYDANQAAISQISFNGAGVSSGAVTSPANAKYCRLGYLATNEDVCTMTVGTSALTPYEPYTSGTTTPVSWQDEAGTVYGGTVDVVTGVLTATMAMVDLGTLSWLKVSSNYKSFQGSLEGIKYNYNRTTVMSSSYVGTNGNDASASADCYIWVDGSKTVAIKDTSKADMSAADFKAAMSGVQLVYELATPQTYQLTPQQILTLLGNNTVFVDTGSVSVTYQASIKGYIDKVLAS